MLDQLDLVNRIIADPANGYPAEANNAERFDPEEIFIEWSPDSKKFLFRYAFADEAYESFGGYGVYNIAAETVEQVVKLSESEVAEWLAKFKWE